MSSSPFDTTYGVPQRLVREDIGRRAKRLRRVARLLDEAYRVPGTNFRFGLDGIVGLIPGVGDIATGMISLYLIFEASRLGVPRRTLLRMLANAGIDATIGALPLVGDLADLTFQANRRNARLVERHLQRYKLEGK
ncbi:MAG: DUF4112 domain-containing protein [Pirellulaceae bacterium]